MRDLGTAVTGNDILAVSDRERILQAMAECCAEAGYGETTVDAVLVRAGVDRDGFTSHFGGKEDCALAALNQIVSETLARISMTKPNSDEPAARRKFEGKAILELLEARPSFAKLALVESRQCGTTRMHDAYDSASRVLALMLERISDSTERPGTAARAALGGAEAVVRRELAAGRAVQISRLLPDFVYAVLVPFVGQGEALRQAKLAAKLAAEEG